MPLSPGTRVGNYEVVSKIGSGGMGEVYRGRDTRLNREVALKTLPDSLKRDPDRIARFEREAQTLAALNHPNIAIIHGVEDTGNDRALVMELVEGPTLAELLAGGRLPSDDARKIALQMADALEAAHEQGVIHRDLKPANIKVRPDGTVKVLDFGLAKVFGPGVDSQAQLGNSPTITAPMMTSAGVVLGTAAYMSPEQARGRAVDKRGDIWAFGCVLYEMLAGRPAFDGDNVTDILAAVVQREPDWSLLPPDAPAAMTSVIRRCLEKNPRERLRDIGDARLELRSDGAVIDPGSRPAPRSVRPVGVAAVAFVAGLVAAGLLFYAWVASRSSASAGANRPMRVTLSPPSGVTLSTASRGSSVALSPDGRRLVFVGQEGGGPPRLYLRELDRFEAVAIAETDGAATPFFSPDGTWVGFFADGRLKKVSLAGGAPLALAKVLSERGHAWLRDDSIIVTPASNAGMMRLPSGGTGRGEPFTSLNQGELSHRWPSQLPDASAVLFSIWNDTGWDLAQIAAQRPGSQQRIVVLEAGGGYPRYLHDPSRGSGYLVYARAEGLLAARFDPSTLTLTGAPVPVVDAVLTNNSGGAHFDLARDGTLVYIPGTNGENKRELAWVTREGQRSPAVRIPGAGRFYSLDPTGKRVLRVNAVGQRDLWMEDLERGTSTRLMSGEGWFTGIWSPDADWVVYPKGFPMSNLYRVRARADSPEERLTTGSRRQLPTSISPDGTMLVYEEGNPTTGSDIWVMRLPAPGTAAAPPPEARPLVSTRAAELQGRISADGRWLAYQSNESGRFEVYIRSFPDGDQTTQVSNAGGLSPVWSRKGTDLFYRSMSGSVMLAAVTSAPALAVSASRPLFDARGYETMFDVAPDNQRFLMMPVVASEAAGGQIHVILNFLEELRQRVR
jgi:eukaryotic-like serine/threonine-protein kinase